MRETTPATGMTASTEESLSIILAAYQEGENLSILLPRLTDAARKLTPEHEILVIDTPMPLDDTEAICAANQVRFLRRQPSNDYPADPRQARRAESMTNALAAREQYAGGSLP